MNKRSIKKLVLSLILTLGSFLTLPAYAWPEVDHMNMCGSAVKVVRGYSNNWQGWNQHDNYITRRGNNYYYRTNCPEIAAPIKIKKGYIKPQKKARFAVSSKAKKFRRTVKYDEHADCARVDRLNSLGLATTQKRRY